ncbi:MAG: hypothetical protein ACYCO0_02990 [Candidatus Micrarchaeaceae archaeon]
MKGKSKKRKMLYIKLSSLDDLCRYACNFDYTNATIMSIKAPSGYRIFAIGEELGETYISYYINAAKKESLISYSYPSSSSQRENSHFTEQVGGVQSHCMSVISIANAGFKQAAANGIRGTMLIGLSSPHDIVSAIVKSAAGGSTIPHMYSFDYGGRKALCAFDAIPELSGEDNILYYSFMEKNATGSFARYKYAENKVDFTDYMGEHSYMYVKIINLAEPFPFFKVPD